MLNGLLSVVSFFLGSKVMSVQLPAEPSYLALCPVQHAGGFRVSCPSRSDAVGVRWKSSVLLGFVCQPDSLVVNVVLHSDMLNHLDWFHSWIF